MKHHSIIRTEVPDTQALTRDARKIFNVLKAGGVGIMPFDVSYAIFAHTARGVERIYELKRRSSAKPNGVIGSWDLFNEVMHFNERERDIVKCITMDHNLPMSVVGNYRADHDFFQTTQFGALRRSTKGETVDLFMNAGALHTELARLSLDSCTPLMGSSANLSLQGNKFVFDDIEPELLDNVDIAVDYGRCKYANPYFVGSTIIELGSLRVLRFGCCYEDIQRVLGKEFGMELPDRPTSGSMSLV